MNTKHILLTICTALSAVVALMGCAQKAKTELAQQGPIHYRIEGNIGRPEVTDTQIPYPQMFNVKQTELDLYGIDGIPHIILFGPDGTILARDLRGDAIEKKLSEIFK